MIALANTIMGFVTEQLFWFTFLPIVLVHAPLCILFWRKGSMKATTLVSVISTAYVFLIHIWVWLWDLFVANYIN